MSDLGFLTDHAWLDDDGIHVWSAHDCLNGERVVTMLPSPTWSAREVEYVAGLQVTPSIACGACGYHNTPRIGAVCERLKRPCSREPGHHGECSQVSP